MFQRSSFARVRFANGAPHQFMNALLPEHEPDFRSLRHLISTAPPTRLEAVFPPAPQSANVSAPVVLSLAYRLAQVIGASSSPLQKEDLKQIEWLRRSLMAMDGKVSRLPQGTRTPDSSRSAVP